MSRGFVAIIGLLLFVFIGVYGLQAAVADAGQNKNVVNETWVPQGNTAVQLEHTGQQGAHFANQTTVYNESSPGQQEQTEHEDYEWMQDNGSVRALNNGDIIGKDNATVSYDYVQTSPMQRELAAMFGKNLQVIGLLGPLFGFMLILLVFKR